MSLSQHGTTAPPEWSAGLGQWLERIDAESDAIVARTVAWSAVNSGSYEQPGLSRMRILLADAYSDLPGAIEIVGLAPIFELSKAIIDKRVDAAIKRPGPHVFAQLP